MANKVKTLYATALHTIIKKATGIGGFFIFIIK